MVTITPAEFKRQTSWRYLRLGVGGELKMKVINSENKHKSFVDLFKQRVSINACNCRHFSALMFSVEMFELDFLRVIPWTTFALLHDNRNFVFMHL